MERLLTGQEVYEAFAGGHHEVSGFFEGLDEAGIGAAIPPVSPPDDVRVTSSRNRS